MDFKQADEGGWTYTTVDGDAVDLVAFNFYGEHGKATEAILDANPGLAGYGPIVPEGVVIVLPDLEQSPTPKTQISLWD